MNDKEAIERLNRFKTIKVMYGNTFAMHLEQLKQLQQDLETILNILEKQKAEIEKKDKIIDKIVYYLSDFDIDEMCGKCDKCIGNGCYVDDDIEFKINCIKKYFEKKAEEDK